MKSPKYDHGRRRGSVFRTSDWGVGETETPGDIYLWDYAEVDSDGDGDGDGAELSDEHDRLSTSVSSRRSSRRSTCWSTDESSRRRHSSMWEWDYREILPSPQRKAWDCRGLPRMQIRCCEQKVQQRSRPSLGVALVSSAPAAPPPSRAGTPLVTSL